MPPGNHTCRGQQISVEAQERQTLCVAAGGQEVRRDQKHLGSVLGFSQVQDWRPLPLLDVSFLILPNR